MEAKEKIDALKREIKMYENIIKVKDKTIEIQKRELMQTNDELFKLKEDLKDEG